jgi:hypothetical protein
VRKRKTEKVCVRQRKNKNKFVCVRERGKSVDESVCQGDKKRRRKLKNVMEK